jgi:hypothetical protein
LKYFAIRSSLQVMWIAAIDYRVAFFSFSYIDPKSPACKISSMK